MEWTWLAVPGGIGLLLGALIEVLKAFGIVKDSFGGILAMGGSIIIAAVLTLAVEIGGLDVANEQYVALVELAGLMGQILVTFLGSFVTHKTAKTAELLPQYRE